MVEVLGVIGLLMIVLGSLTSGVTNRSETPGLAACCFLLSALLAGIIWALAASLDRPDNLPGEVILLGSIYLLMPILIGVSLVGCLIMILIINSNRKAQKSLQVHVNVQSE